MTREIKFFHIFALTTAAALVIAVTQDPGHRGISEDWAPTIERSSF